MDNESGNILNVSQRTIDEIESNHRDRVYNRYKSGHLGRREYVKERLTELVWWEFKILGYKDDQLTRLTDNMVEKIRNEDI
jgi:hypothetical protein